MGENGCYITNKEKKSHITRIIAVIAVIIGASFLGGWWGSKIFYYGEYAENQGLSITVSFEDIKLSIYNNPTQRILVTSANAARYMVDSANITFMLIAEETIALFNEYKFENESEAVKYFNVTSSDMLIIKSEYVLKLSSFVAENASLPLNASMGLDNSEFAFMVQKFSAIIKEMSFRVIDRTANSIVDTVVTHPYDLSEINAYLINGTEIEGIWKDNSIHAINLVGFDYYQSTASIGRIKYDIDGISAFTDL